MDNIVFLIVRRMRQPLLTLIVVYAISVLGLVLIPGRDAAGETWHLSIFHAMYFVSYMATTIGFGEIPQEFSDGQRLWVTLTLYVSVMAWIYAFGTILALIQDRNFQEALSENYFARRIRKIREPFHLVCGYGETGSALVEALTSRGQHAVVIDIDETRTTMVQMNDLREYVPALHGDAAVTKHLQEAGLQNPACIGVVALTNDNEANLKIAITAKLLNTGLKVICRADSHDIEANMASFGTDYIIDPFDNFGATLTLAFRAPCLYLLERWLTGVEDTDLADPVYPPREGHWIVCGYGRLGRAVCARLAGEGIEVVVVEADPGRTGRPNGRFVAGRGTEAHTLHEADVENAVGLVAGTDDDANNLSIVMTARELNPELFFVVRKNNADNQAIIDAVGGNMVMHPSTIIADKIRVLLATPMLYEFTSLAQGQDDGWACELVSRVSALVNERVPHIEEWSIDAEDAGALLEHLQEDGHCSVEQLLCDPWKRERDLNAILLLIARRDDRVLLPGPDIPLKRGDRLLICGDRAAFTRMRWTVTNRHTLDYVLTGQNKPESWIWRRLLKSS